jgi:uncharacterized protein (TIGR03067 family)
MHTWVIATGLLLGAPALKDKSPSIVGTWDLVATVQNGHETPEQGRQDEFTDDGRWIIRGIRPRNLNWNYTIDPKSQPAVIKWWEGDSDRARGIYRVEGDTLKFAINPLGPPPETFESSEGSSGAIFIYKRAKPKK